MLVSGIRRVFLIVLFGWSGAIVRERCHVNVCIGGIREGYISLLGVLVAMLER